MRWILKIILFPIRLLLSILTAFLTFLLGIGTTILYFLMLMCIVAAIGSFMQKDVKYVASAVSPQKVGSTKATTARATTATVSAGCSQAKLPTAFAPSHAKYKC